MKQANDIYGGKDPSALAAYSVTEAGRHLQLPYATVRSWVAGRHYTTSDGVRKWQSIIVPDGESAEAHLSFRNLVELYVLGGIRRYNIKLPKVRKAIRYLRDESATDHPLADHDLYTDSLDLYLQRLGKLLNITDEPQQSLLFMRAALERIERNLRRNPVRLFPYTTPRIDERARLVSIDPRVMFGRPCIAGTRIPTSIVADRFKAGDAIQLLVDDLGIREEQVEAALRYEQPPLRQAA